MILKERLEEAVELKKNDLNSFIWKGPKKEVNGEIMQEVVPLMTATEEQLNRFYKHCWSMLYNTDKQNPGRCILMDIIKDQIERCNCELFIRWIESEKKYPRFTFVTTIRNVLDSNKDTMKDPDKLPISTIVGGVPDEFANLPIGLVIESCIDRLGKFNRKHLTLTFILKQGLWFTPQELEEFTIKNEDGTIKDRIALVKERLGLKPDAGVYLTPKGLSFNQLQSMITLRSKKYSELTSDQLKTLRNVILFSLGEEVRFHESQWLERINQIKIIAKERGVELEEPEEVNPNENNTIN